MFKHEISDENSELEEGNDGEDDDADTSNRTFINPFKQKKTC